MGTIQITLVEDIHEIYMKPKVLLDIANQLTGKYKHYSQVPYLE